MPKARHLVLYVSLIGYGTDRDERQRFLLRSPLQDRSDPPISSIGISNRSSTTHDICSFNGAKHKSSWRKTQL
jgi:hypothetical protein